MTSQVKQVIQSYTANKLEYTLLHVKGSSISVD